MTRVRTIEIFGRPGCHLCDDARRVVEAARRRFGFELIERNVEDDPAWEREHGLDVPVVFIDGRRAFKHHVPAAALERYFERH